MKYEKIVWLTNNDDEKQHIEAVKKINNFNINIVYADSLNEISGNSFIVISTEYAKHHISEIKKYALENPDFINLQHYDPVEAVPLEIFDLLDYNNILKPEGDKTIIEKYLNQVN